MKNNVKFEEYENLLREWSSRMNLVAPSTLADIKTRHFADSAQLADVLPPNVNIPLDLLLFQPTNSDKYFDTINSVAIKYPDDSS